MTRHTASRITYDRRPWHSSSPTRSKVASICLPVLSIPLETPVITSGIEARFTLCTHLLHAAFATSPSRFEIRAAAWLCVLSLANLLQLLRLLLLLKANKPTMIMTSSNHCVLLDVGHLKRQVRYQSPSFINSLCCRAP
ncbi:hypothetical protein EJ03DRAFT_92381 [Teratosphaeria nubilosa]|uniref:Uncharacterized protein n=1 Tax=Teratosphaeria nubilosa TaxID=161662 RepID=A0A6G1LA06_9PEZI|nr:hypothetical protein EJ03DRAFT_92381 [Teratosphaeria nubilosa]